MAPIDVHGFTASLIRQMMDGGRAPQIKQYFVTDDAGNPTDIYYAQNAAAGGDVCLRQRLVYAETASGVQVVQKIAWQNDTWSGAEWDIPA